MDAPLPARSFRVHLGEIVALFALATALYAGIGGAGHVVRFAMEPDGVALDRCADAPDTGDACIALESSKTSLASVAPFLGLGLGAGGAAVAGLLLAGRRRGAVLTAGLTLLGLAAVVVLASYF